MHGSDKPDRGSKEHRNTAYRAEQRTQATRDVERATEDGQNRVVIATSFVHDATAGACQATLPPVSRLSTDRGSEANSQTFFDGLADSFEQFFGLDTGSEK